MKKLLISLIAVTITVSIFAIENKTKTPVKIETKKVAVVDCSKCDGSSSCAPKMVCPTKAISRRFDGKYLVDASRCTGCGICTRYCGRGAIKMTEVEVQPQLTTKSSTEIKK